jgi:hypothetical protein
MTEKIRELFFKKDLNIYQFSSFDSSYLFTTENINEFLPNLSNKKTIMVTSSGDYFFNALINNCTNITLFDVNEFSKYILKLKKKAIENLDYEHFLAFFGLLDEKYFFNLSIYESFYKYLDDETLFLWNKIYDFAEYDPYNIMNSNIFIKPSSYDKNAYLKLNNYLNEKNYLKLKKILSNINDKDIKFIKSDLTNLKHFLTNKYDYMFLSNICDYMNNQQFIENINSLNDFLEDNGKIYFAYLYNDDNTNYENIKYEVINITSSHKYFYHDNSKDKVYIYKK